MKTLKSAETQKVRKDKIIQVRVPSELYEELLQEQRDSMFENLAVYVRYLLGKNPKRKRAWK